MNRTWASITLPITALTAALLTAQPISASDSTAQDPKSSQKGRSKSAGTSLTGCVDEQDGHYVLVDDRNLTPIANLEAEGFPVESFAKHLGHKVTVRGTVNPAASPAPGGKAGDTAGERSSFKVRSIETVSESCGPQHQ
jgi:hypothetical protein